MSSLAQEHDAINLSQGFPNFDPPEALQLLVYEHMRAGHNQYAPMPGLPALRRVLAEKLGAGGGYTPDPDTEITVTAGATQGLFTAITAVIHPGDEAILFEPAYDSYRPAIELCGGVVKTHRLRAPDYRVNWEAVANLLTARTRLVVVNTPHNPTGTVFGAADWEALRALLADWPEVMVLSDEVYEHLVYDGTEHRGLLHYPDLYQRGFATYSFGKTFHGTGWKVGYCVAPPELMKEFRKVHQFAVFAVNTPAQHALADYLRDPATYADLGDFYQRKRDFLQTALADSPLRALPCRGTYFQLYDYGAVSHANDQEFARWLTTERGVAVIPVSAFSHDDLDERVIRICFAKTEDVLAAAAERLRQL